jgi:hypothetical protein
VKPHRTWISLIYCAHALLSSLATLGLIAWVACLPPTPPIVTPDSGDSAAPTLDASAPDAAAVDAAIPSTADAPSDSFSSADAPDAAASTEQVLCDALHAAKCREGFYKNCVSRLATDYANRLTTWGQNRACLVKAKTPSDFRGCGVPCNLQSDAG